MRNTNVIVAGHQFADPLMWIEYLAKRFKKQTWSEILHEPDRCVLLETRIDNDNNVFTKAPFHPLLHEKDSYQMLFKQHADVMIYIHSVIADTLHLTKRDFKIVSGILAELPTCPPVLTLLNDSYCGNYHGTHLTEEELKDYIIPDSQVFRTAIGYRPTSGNCSIGADEVFDELLNICNDMRR